MRRRLYFVLPDVPTARQVFDELLLARVEERHMHFLARRDADLGDLPRASVTQKTDLVHGMEIGLVAGAATGAVLGFLALHVGEAAEDVGMGVVFLLALVGAVFGVWASGMVGASAPNQRLKAFAGTIDQGHLLLMLDVGKDRVHEVSQIIRRHHPEAEEHGVEPTIPAFP